MSEETRTEMGLHHITLRLELVYSRFNHSSPTPPLQRQASKIEDISTLLWPGADGVET